MSSCALLNVFRVGGKVSNRAFHRVPQTEEPSPIATCDRSVQCPDERDLRRFAEEERIQQRQVGWSFRCVCSSCG